ncbi:MAG: hypothetical protein H7263_03705 [Candidatus Sericytochromatia bacterium]|nr:hypothetical protein [Candidatus Sericytochromatia bacterium]
MINEIKSYKKSDSNKILLKNKFNEKSMSDLFEDDSLELKVFFEKKGLNKASRLNKLVKLFQLFFKQL